MKKGLYKGVTFLLVAMLMLSLAGCDTTPETSSPDGASTSVTENSGKP